MHGLILNVCMALLAALLVNRFNMVHSFRFNIIFPKLIQHLYILDAVSFADVKRRNTYIQGRPSRVNLTVLANSDGTTFSLTDWCKKTHEVVKMQKELEKNMVLNKFRGLIAKHVQ
jgi:hypothetical protein